MRRWIAALALMLIWWAVTYGFGSIPIPELQPGWFPNLGTVATNGLSLGVVWVAAVLFHRAGWLGSTPLRDLAGWRRGELRMLWLLTPVLLVQLSYVWVGRDGVPGLEGTTGAMASLAIGMLAVGVSEETASRGLPLGALAAKGRLWGGVIVTALTFGLWHLGNGLFYGQSWVETWWQVLGAATFGVCFAGMRLVTGTIWPAIVLHALGNWTQLSSPGAAPEWYQITVMAFEVVWGVVLTAISARRMTARR